MNFFYNFFKNWFRNLIVLLALARFYPGFVIPYDFGSQLFTSFVLTAITIFFQPILKMIVLPVNIITFGMFTWLLEALILLLLTLIIDQVSFKSFSFSAFSFMGIIIPQGEINIILSVFLGSIMFKFLQSLIKYISES